MLQIFSGLREPKSPKSPRSPKSPGTFQEFVNYSPRSSPSLARRFPNAISPPTKLAMEFSSPTERIGQVVIKLLEGTGQMESEFESLVTGSRGYGYQGTSVYACCRNEWCLIGNVLYNIGSLSMQDEDEEDPEESKKPTVYREYKGIPENLTSTHHDTIGSVVLVGSDLDWETNTWTLGPQFKICLSESLIKSGRVVGIVTEGLEVAQEVSQQFENTPRITISKCGYY